MASRRLLKKRIQNIAGEMFFASLFEGVDRPAIIEATRKTLELIPRISHTEPGNVKGFYKQLEKDLMEQVDIVNSELEK